MFSDRTPIPTLPASDIGRAKAWYREKLDLKPVEEMPDGGARFECGDSGFVLYPSEFAGTNKATAAAWMVDDIDSLVPKLRSKGVEFQEFEFEGMKTENGIMTDPDMGKGAWFTDSESNIIALYQQNA